MESKLKNIKDLNLRVNDYPIFLGKLMEDDELIQHKFGIPGIIGRFIIKPNSDETIWFSKNCVFKYRNGKYPNIILPVLDKKFGSFYMYGTSAYLWFIECKLVRFTFQIIKNKIMADLTLKELEQRMKKFLGESDNSEYPFVMWGNDIQMFLIEYPLRTHGYIHLVDKDYYENRFSPI